MNIPTYEERIHIIDVSDIVGVVAIGSKYCSTGRLHDLELMDILPRVLTRFQMYAAELIAVRKGNVCYVLKDRFGGSNKYWMYPILTWYIEHLKQKNEDKIAWRNAMVEKMNACVDAALHARSIGEID